MCLAGGNMDAFSVLRDVLDDYKSFVHGFLNIRDPEILQKVETEIANGLLWPEPWLALNPRSRPGAPSANSLSADVLHPACREIFRARAAEPIRSGARSPSTGTRPTRSRSRTAVSPTS